MTEGSLSRYTPEMLKEALSHRNGSMPPPRTADADMEMSLSRGEIEGNDILEKGEKFFPETLRPLRLPDILSNRLILSREMLKDWNIKGVGEKPDIKYEVTVQRGAVFEAEGAEYERDADGGIPEFRKKPLADVRHGEGRRVKDRISHIEKGLEPRSFSFDTVHEGSAPGEGVAPPGFLVSPEEHFVRGIKVEDGCLGTLLLQGIHGRGKIIKKGVAPNVHHCCNTALYGGPVLFEEDEKLREESRRNIVDGEHALVLQDLERRGLSRSGHSGDDDASFHSPVFILHQF